MGCAFKQFGSRNSGNWCFCCRSWWFNGRFGLTGNSLVAVDSHSYYNVNISDAANPKLESQVQINSGVETMFLYTKYMFLGTTTGMLVYDLSDLNKPVYISSFWHATGCDPVVVQNNRAYVTIRGGIFAAATLTGWMFWM